MIGLDLSHLYVLTGIVVGIWILSKSKRISFFHSRKILAIILIVPSVAAIPFHLSSLNLIEGYNTGDVYLSGTQRWSGTLSPGEAFEINQLSNWYVVCSVYAYVTPSDNITLSLMDINNQSSEYILEVSKFNSTSFRLPYLYTEPGQIANWSLMISNPTLENQEFVFEPSTLEDTMYIVRSKAYKSAYLPMFLVMTIFFSVSIISIVESRTEKDVRFNTPEKIAIAILLSVSLMMAIYLEPLYFNLLLPALSVIIIVYVFGNLLDLLKVDHWAKRSINTILISIPMIFGALLIPMIFPIALLIGVTSMLTAVLIDFSSQVEKETTQ